MNNTQFQSDVHFHHERKKMNYILQKTKSGYRVWSIIDHKIVGCGMQGKMRTLCDTLNGALEVLGDVK